MFVPARFVFGRPFASFFSLVPLCATLLAANVTFAQPAPQQPQVQILRIDGTINKVTPQMLQVTASDGIDWLLAFEIDPKTIGENVVIKGTAEPAWLRAGMLVRFTATLNERGQSEGDLAEVLAFDAHRTYSPGVLPAGLDQAFAEEESPRQPRRGRGIEPGEYLVTGRLTSVRNGLMTVQAGPVAIKAQLAEEAVVQLEMTDHRLAREGDKFSAEGYYLQAGQGMVHRLTVELAKPLEGPRRPAPRNSRKPMPEEPDDE